MTGGPWILFADGSPPMRLAEAVRRFEEAKREASPASDLSPASGVEESGRVSGRRRVGKPGSLESVKDSPFRIRGQVANLTPDG